MTDEHRNAEQAVPGTAAPSQAPRAARHRASPRLEDRLLRTAAADFDNYKKRAAREREEYVTLANERLVKELLPILDDLERALDAVGEHQEAAVEEGVRLVHRSLAIAARAERRQGDRR